MNIKRRAVKSSSGWSRSGLLSLRLIVTIFFLRCIDGDLDNDGTATDFFILEEFDGFLLLLLVSYVNKTITFAFPGTPISPANDASRDNVDTSLGKEGTEAGFVNIEAKIGNKEHGLRRFSNRVFPRGANGTLNPGLTGTGPRSCRSLRRPLGLRSGGGGRGLIISLRLSLVLRIYEQLYAAIDGRYVQKPSSFSS
jgi:hypothetical protein